MIRVAEHVARTDTGHQRATNEDSHLERTPLFVVADGMGGAQAGEVASQVAISHFSDDLAPSADGAVELLVRAAQDANAEIHALAEADSRRAGMGTTLTAAYVGGDEVFLVHVGDSRAYRLRDAMLERITEDHSLVEELLRQGRLTEEEAEEHPQRSIITRALGPEPEVEIDTFTVDGRAGDVFLLCSDGLTSMVGESAIETILRGAPDLDRAADELVRAALAAGGRDNVTVLLFRLEDVGAYVDAPTEPTPVVAPVAPEPRREPVPPPVAAQPPVRRVRRPRPAQRRAPRLPRRTRTTRSRRRRRLTVAAVLVGIIAVLVVAGLLAAQSVYFIGTDANGQVTIYNGLPYTLPGGVRLYTSFFVSGVTSAELSTLEQKRLFNNELRSQGAATRLVDQLELDRIAGQ
jgi:PPM family protein phosphatase